MKTKPIILFLIVVISSITLGGPSKSIARDCNADRPIRLEMIYHISSDWRFNNYGLTHAQADFPDIELQAVCPPMEVERHSDAIKGVLRTTAEGLAITVIDAEKLNKDLEKAAVKIPLVTFNYDGNRGLSKTFVGHDEFAHGWFASHLIRRAAAAETPIHLFTQVGHSHAEARVDGIKKGLRGTKISISKIHDNGQDAQATHKTVRKLLTDTEGPMVLVSVWHNNAEAILKAIREEDRLGEVKLVCFDRSKAVFEGIRSGDVVGTVLQDPHRLVYETVRVLRAHVLGVDPKTTHQGAHAVRGGIVDQDNLADYLKYQQSIFDNEDEVDFFPFNPKDEKQEKKSDKNE